MNQPFLPTRSIVLAEWLDTLSGKAQDMSGDIDAKVNQKLVGFCDTIQRNVDEQLVLLDEEASRWTTGSDRPYDLIDTVKWLWLDQKRVANLVKSSVEAGTAY
jgi:hypothetical protein